MAIVVDTCSLVMIAKNYLPLDKDGQLYSFLEEAFSRKDLMLLDVILDESKRTSKGIAVEKMPFLKDKKLVIPGENGAYPPTKSGSIHPLVSRKSA